MESLTVFVTFFLRRACFYRVNVTVGSWEAANYGDGNKNTHGGMELLVAGRLASDLVSQKQKEQPHMWLNRFGPVDSQPPALAGYKLAAH